MVMLRIIVIMMYLVMLCFFFISDLNYKVYVVNGWFIICVWL